MSDTLDWLDLFDLKQKRLVHHEDEDVSPRYHLNSPGSPALRDSGALCSRLSSACAVTVRSRARSTWPKAFLRQSFRATFSAGVLRGLPASGHSVSISLDSRLLLPERVLLIIHSLQMPVKQTSLWFAFLPK